MEVFVKDEDKKWDISYDLANQNNSLDCKDHKPIILKSIDHHDLEIRADERKKWQDKFDELSKFIEQPKNSIYYDTSLYVPTELLQQKLTELKGE
jgi:hypothetical protein